MFRRLLRATHFAALTAMTVVAACAHRSDSDEPQGAAPRPAPAPDGVAEPRPTVVSGRAPSLRIRRRADDPAYALQPLDGSAPGGIDPARFDDGVAVYEGLPVGVGFVARAAATPVGAVRDASGALRGVLARFGARAPIDVAPLAAGETREVDPGPEVSLVPVAVEFDLQGSGDDAGPPTIWTEIVCGDQRVFRQAATGEVQTYAAPPGRLEIRTRRGLDVRSSTAEIAAPLTRVRLGLPKQRRVVLRIDGREHAPTATLPDGTAASLHRLNPVFSDCGAVPPPTAEQIRRPADYACVVPWNLPVRFPLRRFGAAPVVHEAAPGVDLVEAVAPMGALAGSLASVAVTDEVRLVFAKSGGGVVDALLVNDGDPLGTPTKGLVFETPLPAGAYRFHVEARSDHHRLWTHVAGPFDVVVRADQVCRVEAP